MLRTLLLTSRSFDRMSPFLRIRKRNENYVYSYSDLLCYVSFAAAYIVENLVKELFEFPPQLITIGRIKDSNLAQRVC